MLASGGRFALLCLTLGSLRGLCLYPVHFNSDDGTVAQCNFCFIIGGVPYGVVSYVSGMGQRDTVGTQSAVSHGGAFQG